MNAIEDILNDPFFIEMMEKEEKELEASGWTYEDIQQMAKFITKNN